jgi:GH25 family lysozyme M1 (1,4-beta-N-acetylmuramidase)
MSKPEGIDVSNVGQSNTIDWAAVGQAGVAFAYIKATQSTGFSDPSYGRNRAGAAKAGIISGAYHYWRPDADASVQIQHFHNVYGDWRPGDLPPCLDVELDAGELTGYTPAQLVAHVSLCLQAMEQLCGKRPVIYTYPAFWRERMGNSQAFNSYPLWIAAYPGPPPTIGGWADHVIHQYTDQGSVDGCPHVDRDTFNGTLADLRAFCGIVDNPPTTNRFFPQTAQYISHGFKDYWEALEKVAATDGSSANIAMQCIGYPIGPEQAQVLGDGNSYTVQYFERARFELHDGKVLLGLLGAEVLAK